MHILKSKYNLIVGLIATYLRFQYHIGSNFLLWIIDFSNLMNQTLSSLMFFHIIIVFCLQIVQRRCISGTQIAVLLEINTERKRSLNANTHNPWTDYKHVNCVVFRTLQSDVNRTIQALVVSVEVNDLLLAHSWYQCIMSVSYTFCCFIVYFETRMLWFCTVSKH